MLLEQRGAAFSLDSDGVVTSWNGLMASLTDISAARAVGTPLVGLVVAPAAHEAAQDVCGGAEAVHAMLDEMHAKGSATQSLHFRRDLGCHAPDEVLAEVPESTELLVTVTETKNIKRSQRRQLCPLPGDNSRRGVIEGVAQSVSSFRKEAERHANESVLADLARTLPPESFFSLLALSSSPGQSDESPASSMQSKTPPIRQPKPELEWHPFDSLAQLTTGDNILSARNGTWDPSLLRFDLNLDNEKAKSLKILDRQSDGEFHKVDSGMVANILLQQQRQTDADGRVRSDHLRQLTDLLNVFQCSVASKADDQQAHDATKMRLELDLTRTGDYTCLRPISQGSYGSVFLASLSDNPEELRAIKVLKKEAMVMKNAVGNCIAEQNSMIAAEGSPFVCRLFESFQSRDKLFLVMEFCAGGDLFSLLQSLGALDEELACFYTAEVVLALQHCHRLKVVHHDIKPDNILIDKLGHIRLTDFGLSRSVVNQAESPKLAKKPPRMRSGGSANSRDQVAGSATCPATPCVMTPEHTDQDDWPAPKDSARPAFNNGNSTAPCSKVHTPRKRVLGTTPYIPPEAISAALDGPPVHEKLEPAADWWALGCVLYELLTGVPVYYGETEEDTWAQILECKLPPPPPDASPEAYDLICSLLSKSPSARLRFAQQLQSHPFFKEINWATLRQSTPPWVPDPVTARSLEYFEPRAEAFPVPDLSNDIKFVGPVEGQSKGALFRNFGYTSASTPAQNRSSEEDRFWHVTREDGLFHNESPQHRRALSPFRRVPGRPRPRLHPGALSRQTSATPSSSPKSRQLSIVPPTIVPPPIDGSMTDVSVTDVSVSGGAPADILPLPSAETPATLPSLTPLSTSPGLKEKSVKFSQVTISIDQPLIVEMYPTPTESGSGSVSTGLLPAHNSPDEAVV